MKIVRTILAKKICGKRNREQRKFNIYYYDMVSSMFNAQSGFIKSNSPI